MSDIWKAKQATPSASLEEHIMDPNVPKNEREWWAANEIERLRAALTEIRDAGPMTLDDQRWRIALVALGGDK
jgi:hypothetical protein